MDRWQACLQRLPAIALVVAGPEPAGGGTKREAFAAAIDRQSMAMDGGGARSKDVFAKDAKKSAKEGKVER